MEGWRKSHASARTVVFVPEKWQSAHEWLARQGRYKRADSQIRATALRLIVVEWQLDVPCQRRGRLYANRILGRRAKMRQLRCEPSAHQAGSETHAHGQRL